MNLPPRKVWVRKEYLYDLRKGHGEYVLGYWVSLKSIWGRSFYFETYMPEYGACFDKLPISAFLDWDPGSPEAPMMDELDDDLKSKLSEKLAIHSNLGVLLLSGGDPKDAKTVEHPVFREHPETGKKALYVTEAFVKSIKDMDSKESQRILEILYKHASKKEYIYRHKWSNGDLVVWDNRSVQHYAEHGYGDKTRTMHRLTTSGSKPF